MKQCEEIILECKKACINDLNLARFEAVLNVLRYILNVQDYSLTDKEAINMVKYLKVIIDDLNSHTENMKVSE